MLKPLPSFLVNSWTIIILVSTSSAQSVIDSIRMCYKYAIPHSEENPNPCPQGTYSLGANTDNLM